MADAQRRPAGPAIEPQPPLRVLHVEDDRVCALLFAQALLAEPRLTLCSAETGAEALALAAAWRPEVLVLDAHLPDTDGHALLSRLRALPGLAGLPAIMCSADSEAEDRERARRAGFDGCWPKPLDPAQARADLLLLLAALNPASRGGLADNPGR